MKERKVIVYRDELNDEFSEAQITPKKIGDDYVYLHTSLWKRFTHFFWYRVVATPTAVLYLKGSFHHRIVNRKVLKPYRKTGYFLYGNHTQDIGGAFIPSMVTFPKTAYVIVHPNNVSMPFLGRVTASMGALPLPDTMRANRNFVQAVETRFREGNAIVIYPEAHIWPYYTKIRPFPDASFSYPLRLNSPVFCFTDTYQKRKFGKKPRIVTYVDGPFFPNSDLPLAARRADLRDRVYQTMCERSKRSEVEYIKYRKEGEAE